MGKILVGTTSWTEKTLIDSGLFYPPVVKTPEVWVNRAKAPAEELGVTPAKMGEKLTDVVEFVKVAKA